MNKKIILVACGHGLLGGEFAYTLSKDDNNEVIILDLPSKKINRLIKKSRFYPIDITDEEDVKTTIYQIYDNYDRIDILINCAAINFPPKEGVNNSFEIYSLDKWNKTLAVNLTGAFLLSRECIKYMLKNKNEGFKGTIINIASDLGIITSDQSIYENGYKKPPDYGVSKAGLLHLTKYIASYYGNKIKSVALSPGSVYNGQSDVLKKNLENRTPIGRLARTDEYNGAIKFLCSSDSDYMQGQNLIMDGGRTIW